MEVDKYEVLEKIGHGSFGVIRKVRRKSDGYVLCRKEISYLKMSQKEREQLHAELSILKTLRHPNIVAYYEREHLKASSDLHIYMEYCENGDLGQKIKELKRNNQMADEDFVWSVLAQTITALYRCHYGEDPPEVGRHVVGLSHDARPGTPARQMVLHRDLKPENIFLGADTSVKLGDFGLSKIMQSHDFASTYVGTPFYMSPEICAAEQYSLHSDIWALGCITYELCAKEPPFNARTHLELIQKIRLGKIKPLPACYSQELSDCISKCLRVNPTARPDTSQLLNIPMVKLKRKELDIVKLGKHMKAREEQAAKTLREAERRLANVETEAKTSRADIENTVRREWEVKARLEIDRLVQSGMDELYRNFEAEVNKRVAEEIKKRDKISKIDEPVRSSTPNHDDLPLEPCCGTYHISQSTTAETDDFPSTTELSELSLESPTLEKSKPFKKSARTPFARAQTMFDGSPMDIAMADPSPAPIASLGLSPRRNGPTRSKLSENVFATASNDKRHLTINDIKFSAQDSDDESLNVQDDDDDTDEVPALPSPTRAKVFNSDPFKTLGAKRPSMSRQKTAPQRSVAQPALFCAQRSKANLIGQKENMDPNTAPLVSKAANISTSPSRRISKLPSASNLLAEAGSPTRKASSTSPTRQASQPNLRPLSKGKAANDDFRHAAMMNNHIQGRTLVELAQARTAVKDFASDDELQSDKPRKGSSGSKTTPVLLWDPEKDEMPSPFLSRTGRNFLTENLGRPGMRHLR